MTEQNETRPPREWLSKGVGVFLIAVLVIAWVATKGGSDESGVSATAAARTVPTALTSRVIEVDSVWIEVSIPPHYLFRTDVEDTVLVRNLFGGVFEKTPDGTILKDGVPVEGFGDPIPGLKLFFQAKGESTKLIFSTWPKS